MNATDLGLDLDRIVSPRRWLIVPAAGSGAPHPTRVFDHRPPPPTQHVLSKTAEQLLADFYRRSLFETMLKDGCTVEFAGNETLRLKRRRAQEVRAELLRAGGSHRWFRHRVREEMRQRKVGRGRETKPSEIADAFFLRLFGGQEMIDQLKGRMFGYRVAADLQEVLTNTPDELDREIIDYLVYSNLLWSGRD